MSGVSTRVAQTDGGQSVGLTGLVTNTHQAPHPHPREELCQQPARRCAEHLKSFIGRSLLFTTEETRQLTVETAWSRPLGRGPSPAPVDRLNHLCSFLHPGPLA